MSSKHTSFQQGDGDYPPPRATTPESGKGGVCPVVPFAPVEKRGLLDQTTAGQPLGNELDDARLGRDVEADKAYAEDMRRQGQSANAGGLDLYGDGAANETKSEAKSMLADGVKVKAKTYNDEA